MKNQLTTTATKENGFEFEAFVRDGGSVKKPTTAVVVPR